MPKAVVTPEEGENLNFALDLELWGQDHVKRCRERFPDATLDTFIDVMRRAKKLGRDPLTDIWQASDGAFLMHAHAMFDYANSTGRYAPGDSVPVYETTDKTDSTNPHGLVRCTVTIKVRSDDGQWHYCPGEAFWDDLVPLVNTRFDNATGQFIGGVVSNASGWASMPHILLRKCAYVDALKRAFPELASFTVREENERGASIDQQRPAPKMPSADVSVADPTGGERVDRTYYIDTNWLDGDSEMVAETDFFDRVTAFLAGEIEEGRPARAAEWFRKNEPAMEDFWLRDQRLTKRKNAVAIKKYHSAAVDAAAAKDAAQSTEVIGTAPATLARPRRARAREIVE